jgi:O-antigen ligase
MTTMTNLRAGALDRRAVEPVADWLAVAVAVSLPWSTTATGILVVLWLIAVLPTLDIAAVRREIASPAGGLPVLLLALGVIGLFWADVSWHERFGGLSPFLRFLVIPLLLAQFRRSKHGMRVLVGFLVSATALLLFSWLVVVFPALPWRCNQPGVPVKDYILQSEEFLICTFVLLEIAFDAARRRRWRVVAALIALVALFLANIVFVATGRTALLVAPVLFLMLGWRQYRWRGFLGAAILFVVGGGIAFVASPYLHQRLVQSVSEVHAYESRDAINSTSLHLEFIRESLSFVATAPIIGHGTGSIAEEFRDATAGHTGPDSVSSVNPHNQILAVAIQLGLVGAAVLVAMWIAHLMLFRGTSLIGWIGLVVVAQNVVASTFNSHLFDFTQAWLYIFGVGVVGGMALRERDGAVVARSAEKHAADPIIA